MINTRRENSFNKSTPREEVDYNTCFVEYILIVLNKTFCLSKIMGFLRGEKNIFNNWHYIYNEPTVVAVGWLVGWFE